MKRRQIFTVAAFSAASLSSPAPVGAVPGQDRGPTLLTLTGAVGRTNRGPMDPSLDQLMSKQQVRFERAYSFDFMALASLPSLTIRPTLEYDRKPHALSGPRLTDVMRAAGAPHAASTRLLLRAIDGYVAALPLGQAQRQGFIVATHLDGRPLPLGGLGPLWAVFDADRAPETADQPLQERFVQCPWGFYHLEIQAA